MLTILLAIASITLLIACVGLLVARASDSHARESAWRGIAHARHEIRELTAAARTAPARRCPDCSASAPALDDQLPATAGTDLGY